MRFKINPRNGVDWVDAAESFAGTVVTLDEVEELERKLTIAGDALKAAKRTHYVCDDDEWYSCPQSEDGCLDENEGPECNCGADQHNAAIDEALAQLDAAPVTDEVETV